MVEAGPNLDRGVIEKIERGVVKLTPKGEKCLKEKDNETT